MSSHSDSFVASGNSPTEPDFVVENHGSIFLLRPLSPAAESWSRNISAKITDISRIGRPLWSSIGTFPTSSRGSDESN